MKAKQRVAIAPPRRVRTAAALIAAVLSGLAGRPAAAQSPTDHFELLVRRGDSAWVAGRFPDARARYSTALALDSMGSSRAVYRLAVLHAWDGQLLRAIPLFQRYTLLEPRDEEGRIALARAYAWNGETDRAVALYDSILTRDKTYRDALLGAAQALAWAGRFRQAIARYDGWLAANPKDVEAELARARTLAWAGRLDRSEQAFAAIAARGERLEAEKGLALVAAWRGDLGVSERRWRAITRRVPNDAEGWVGLAQVLRWSDRPRDARAALDRALAADPKNADAAQQLRWTRAELAPAMIPQVIGSTDSDHNRSLLLSVAGRGYLGRSRVSLQVSQRFAEVTPARGTSTGGRVEGRWHLGSLATVTADLGGVRTHGEDGALTKDGQWLVGGAAATVRLPLGASLGGSLRRQILDETALMLLSRVSVTAWGAETELRLGQRATAAAGVEIADFTGGSVPNRRQAGFGSIRWRPLRSWTVSANGRSLGYDASPRDGYFAPSQFRHLEVGARWSRGRDLGFGVSVDLGLGAQRVALGGPATTRGTQRVGLGLAFRPAPGQEVALDYGYSNVAATGAGPTSGGSLYRSHVLSLRGRVIW